MPSVSPEKVHTYMRYTRVFIELATEFSPVHFLIFAFLFGRQWHSVSFNRARFKCVESGAHEGAACVFQLTSYVCSYVFKTKCLLATFATKNFACCSMGIKDGNWL